MPVEGGVMDQTESIYRAVMVHETERAKFRKADANKGNMSLDD